MVQMLNAQERSETEWQDIISAADSKLELSRILVSYSPIDPRDIYHGQH